MAKGMAMAGGLMSALNGMNGAPPVDAKAREAESKQAQEAAKKTEAEVAAYVAERKKELARLATSLASKRLDLEDAERLYRQPPPSGKLGDRTIRGAMEQLDRSLGGPSSRTDEPSTREEVCRLPILDPIPGDPAVCCLDPPTEDEIWRKIPEPAARVSDRKSSRAAVEKIGEKVDPCKVYPLAGPCQLVHCHYKVTVTLAGAAPWTEVVFIDKDYLRRCGDATHAHAARPRDAGVARAALPAPNADPELRMTRMEEKLDRILKALDRPGRDD
jgi:hypothetical protein